MRDRCAVYRVAAALGLAAGAGQALATWSILIVNTRTREIAVGSATCLTGFDLEANTPVLVPLVGAATAQSFVDANGLNRTFIRDALLRGDTLSATLAGLAARDSGHQTRQYGMIKVNGEALTFSGSSAGPWAGGATGRVGDLAYAVQGNVLTGPPVVSRAVEALLSTPGDLASKLMAGMEAARSMGGDGRCSCGPQADACGAPPPTFTKSAHIAYMLVARAGDVQNCRAAYPTASAPQQLILLDVNGDGYPEVVHTNSGSPSGLTVLPNLTTSGGPARLGAHSLFSAGGVTRGLAAADFNRDGLVDVAVSNFNSSRVLPLLADASGTFRPGTAAGVSAQPAAMITADFDGDNIPDLAVAQAASDAVTMLRSRGDGTFEPARTVTLPGRADGLASADLNGDGRIDLAVVSNAARRITAVLNAGDWAFAHATIHTPSFAPLCIVARDFSGDGAADVVVGGVGTLLRLINSGGGSYSATSVVMPLNVSDVALVNADRDPFPDIVALSSNSNTSSIQVLRGLGSGTFAAPVAFATGFAATRMTTGDLDQDGDDDLAYPSGSGSVVLASNLSRGPGNISFGEPGCASGVSFMDINIANQTAAARDPVYQLQDAFEAWREELAGKPDAVLTEALFENTVPGHRGSRAKMVIRPLDIDGSPANPLWVWKARTPSGDVVLDPMGEGTVGGIVIPEPGCGDQIIEVVAEFNGDRVWLMPAPVLRRTDPADFNGDGWIDGFDYDAYVAAYEAGDSSADFTPRPGPPPVIDTDDYAAFLSFFESGC